MNRLHSDSSRLPSLDGWRAIAILLVLLSHWWATTGSEDIPMWIWYFEHHGDLGVRIFFVLSGFLITFLILREHQIHGVVSLRDFYIRRILRIFPVYFTFLLVLVVLSMAGLYQDVFSSWFGAFTFTRNVVGHGRSATAHLWSLAVEEQFYLLWPLTIVALNLARRFKLAILLLSAAVVVAVIVRIIPCGTASIFCERILGAKSTLKYADSLSIGCMCSYLFVYARHRVPRSQALFFAALGLLVTSAAIDLKSAVLVSLLIFGQAVLTMTCILISVTNDDLKLMSGVLNSTVFRKVGVLSYSIYIWHGIFLSHYMGEKVGAFVVYDWRVWIFACLAVAAVSFYVLERPIMGLRTKFK